MTDEEAKPSPWRRRLRLAMSAWAIVSTVWLAYGFATKGVPEAVLASDDAVRVRSDEAALRFEPTRPPRAALVFLCGAGVAAEAYAPLLRPLADAGHAVSIVRLPWRVAPLPSHRDEAVARAARELARFDDTPTVVGGHSRGAALAAR